MNGKSGFVMVGNWTILDNRGATQSKTVFVWSVSVV